MESIIEDNLGDSELGQLELPNEPLDEEPSLQVPETDELPFCPD